MDELKSGDSVDLQRRRQCLSAMADGEARGDEVSLACAAWREQAQARADWHTYALIGDVLRSDDLARSAGADSAFLARLRQRMAHEPVVLAPVEPVQVQHEPAGLAAVGGLPASRTRRRQWGGPMAVAAGALTVMGVAALMRGVALPEEAPAVVAGVPAQSAAPTAVGPVRQMEALAAAAPTSDAAAGAYLRDPEIDRYLNAHRQYARGAVLATPGGVRQVAASPAGR